MGTYFERLSTDEKLGVFLEAFETPQRFPINSGVGMALDLLERSPEALMREVSQRVRTNATLANQYAFDEIVQAGYRYTTLSSRRALADALDAGLANASGLTPEQRSRLEGAADFMRRSDR